MRIAVLFIVVLAGCASMDPQWTKPGSKSQDFTVDDTQCEAQALAASNAINTLHTRVNYLGCMKAKGWTPPEIPKEEHAAPKHETPKHETSKQAASSHESPNEESPKH
ncbi:MAG: hypothetical protein ABI547_11925 [Betaproteobacteria bacterium]